MQIGDALASFDGTTGDLVAAIEPRTDTGVLSFQASASALAWGALWLYDEDSATPATVPLVRLHAATLKVELARGVRVVDVTAETRKRLGL